MSERVLIVRLGALGDVANVMPAVAGLRLARPKDHITWLVEEGAADLVRMCADVDETLVFPRRRLSHDLRRPWLWPRLCRALRDFVMDLRARAFDGVLDFQGNIKSALLSRATCCPWRAGFEGPHVRECNHLFHSVHVPLPEGPVSRRERAIRLVRALAPDAEPAEPDLRHVPADSALVQEFLATVGHGPRVVIHPGASRFGRFKRWPADRYGRLARALARRRGAQVIVTHGPDDDPHILRRVLDASEGRAVAAPDLTLPQLVVLMRHADLFIGADTGPLHVAALVGAPCVAIFGPKDPRVYAPPGVRVVRRTDVECSPCVKRTCGDLRCLMWITVGQALKAALETLGARTQGTGGHAVT